MSPAAQMLAGAAVGFALWKYVLRTRHIEANPRRRRKKKFVRVRGHMRCMPKKRSKPEPEVVVVERIIERPVAAPVQPSQAPSLSAGATAASSASTNAPEVAQNEVEPTIEDMQLPGYREQNGRGFPWHTAVAAAAIGGGVALVATFAYQSSQRGTQP